VLVPVSPNRSGLDGLIAVAAKLCQWSVRAGDGGSSRHEPGRTQRASGDGGRRSGGHLPRPRR
jgi:hypothetical protein